MRPLIRGLTKGIYSRFYNIRSLNLGLMIKAAYIYGYTPYPEKEEYVRGPSLNLDTVTSDRRAKLKCKYNGGDRGSDTSRIRRERARTRGCTHRWRGARGASEGRRRVRCGRWLRRGTRGARNGRRMRRTRGWRASAGRGRWRGVGLAARAASDAGGCALMGRARGAPAARRWVREHPGYGPPKFPTRSGEGS